MPVIDPNAPWDFWAAIGAWAGAATALLATCVAWWQIRALRWQQRGWETLKACERYDSDPVLNEALRALRDARDSGDLTKNPRKLRLEVTTVMNYLEGVATGIEQGFYEPRVVFDHLEPIIRFHVGEILEPEMVRKLEIQADEFGRVKQLLANWDQGKRPWYKF